MSHLTMRYGRATAVDDLSFEVRPGLVTGFLGPNGAGKSTTMRAVLGLEVPTSGRALVVGRPYTSLRRPMEVMGALLDAGAVHGGRTAGAHLTCLARSNGIGRRRVEAVLDQVGLAEVKDKRVAGFSLGMRQRLGIAAALLGDPGVLMFDEPLNGLDPEGIRWIRDLLRSLAAEGRTVLLSSHLMTEMALTADHVVVIGRGRLIADTTVESLAGRFRRDVLVRTDRAARLAEILRARGGTVTAQDDGGLSVSGLDATEIGLFAMEAAIALSELTPRSASLEEAFMELTEESVEFGAGPGYAGVEHGFPPSGAGGAGRGHGYGTGPAGAPGARKVEHGPRPAGAPGDREAVR